MEPPETSLAGIDTEVRDEEVERDIEVPRFNAQWQNTDTSSLRPTALPVARVQRAWERRPLSPFSRRKVRVGKVWKRPTTSSRAALPETTSQMEGSRGTKRLKARTSLESGMKPVKKLCLDSDFGMGARVSQWERRESPARKIVTRSAAPMVEEDLVALDEEEDGDGVQEDGDITIELLDDEGKVIDVGGVGEAEHEWEDEEDEREDADVLEANDDTMMHLGETVEHAAKAARNTQDDDPEQAHAAHKIDSPVGELSEAPTTPVVTASDMDEVAVEPATESSAAQATNPALRPHSLLSGADVALPEGFVSPVRQRRKLGPRSLRAVSSSRRQTLPVQFAPAVAAATTLQPEAAEDVTVETLGDAAALVTTTASEPLNDSGEADVIPNETSAEETEQKSGGDEWEDVEEEGHSEEGAAPEEFAEESLDEDSAAVELAPEEQMEEMDVESASYAEDDTPLPSSTAPDELRLASPYRFGSHHHDRLPSSPVPTIEGPHPRLPLRRSPRRKSTSPLKQSAILPSTERPHLVAFTPLKRFTPFTDHPLAATVSPNTLTINDLDSVDDIEDTESPIPLRASSAPPESPKMSPRKPAKPRVSDDTALLQAFLNRAAERKSSRRLSTSQQESLVNRRDSDTVREALAGAVMPSPMAKASADVLMELDPNSPSPRKQSAAAAGVDGMNIDLSTTTTNPAEQEDQAEDPAESSYSTKKSGGRRSGRSRKKPQVLSQSQTMSATTAGPNKITIRGPNANTVDVKKSEAQELATTTRNNTRKNKEGCVLPSLRLTKMAAEHGQATAEAKDGGDAEIDGAIEQMIEVGRPVVEGRRGVKWAETLAHYFQGPAPESSENSQLSDEQPEERMPWERGADFDPTVPAEEPKKLDAEGVGKAPAPADTPSKPKPKLRKLKPPRQTAGTATAGKGGALGPVKAESSKIEEAVPEVMPAEEMKAKPAPKARRSRIATPAKGLTNASLLPAEVTAPVPAPAPAAEKKPAPRKRPVSKLPPPGTIAATAAAAPQAAGKENLTIYSPPKKRTAASGLPSVKNFAPKLDFSKSTDLKPPTTINANSEVESGNGSLPGLMSPAKKGGRRAAIFGSGPTAASAFGNGEGRGSKMEVDAMPGLSSPAKKRTRRAAG